jgi:hypothetical protein
MSSLPVEITHVSAVVKGVVSQKISVPPPTHPQCRRKTKHVARTFPVSQSSQTCPRGCAALDPSSLGLAPSSLRLTGRGSAAAGLLQARSAHHDRADAPRRLLSPAPLSLKTECCAADADAVHDCRSSCRGTRARDLCYPSSLRVRQGCHPCPSRALSAPPPPLSSFHRPLLLFPFFLWRSIELFITALLPTNLYIHLVPIIRIWLPTLDLES